MKLDDYEFPGDEMTVTCDLPINDKSVAGSSSSTESSINGFDPKIISCSLLINFNEETIVKEIRALAESVDDNGAQTVYSILNPTANVMGVSKVHFSSKVSLRQMSNHKQAWTLSFTLKEKRSVAERKDERLKSDNSTSPIPAVGTTETTTQSPDTEKQLTNFEQVLNFVNEKLAPSENKTS